MVAKRYSLHLRSTLGSWADPCYNLGETSSTTRDGLTFRWLATQSSAADYAPANNSRLSGRRSPTTSAQILRIDLPDGPGKYRLWVALGALGTTTTQGMVLKDAAGTTLLTVAEASTSTGQVRDTTGAVFTTANWLKSNVSESGMAQAGSTTDITLAASASAITDFYVGKTVSITAGAGSGQIAEIIAYNGTTKVASIRGTWTAPNSSSTYDICDGGGAYFEFTTTGAYIELSRPSSRMDLACVELQYQPDPLTASSITDENGAGTLSTIYSHEPPGKKIGKVTSAAGLQSFTIQGAAATWFSVATIDGSPWLVSTSTRIPANLASVCPNITIRQTTPYETMDTDIPTPTVVDCSARETSGYLGAITSRTWLARKTIRDVTRGELWAGHQGQPFAGGDLSANSDAAFASLYNALTPDGTSWYRIRLQEGGSWNYITGNGLDLSGEKNFGTGGLVIEPDTGHDPILRTQFYKLQAAGVHWRNSLFIPSGNYSFLNEIMYGFTHWPKLRIEGNRIGHMYDAGETVANWSNWNSFILDRFHEQLALLDNSVWGVQNYMIVSGGRLSLEDGTRYIMTPVADVHRFSVGYYLNTPRDVFSNNDSYVELMDLKGANNPDQFTGLGAGVIKHGDWVQAGRPGDGFLYPYDANPNGNPGATWGTNEKCLNRVEKKVYAVQSATTGIASGTLNGGDGPQGGAGAGSIVDGGVTWVYLADFTLEATQHILMENIGFHTDGLTSSTDTGTAKIAPSHQSMIASNAGMLCPNDVVVINSTFATGAGRGIDAGYDGALHIELTSLVGPAERPIDGSTAVTMSNQYCTAGILRAFNSIIGYNSSSTIPGKVDLRNGSDFLAYQGNRAIDWTGIVGSPYRPGDILSGSFTARTGGSWGYSLNETTNPKTDVIMSDLSKQVHPLNGLAGGRMTEYHTVTITDAAAGSIQTTLTVNP